MSDSYKLTIMKDGQWREVGCFEQSGETEWGGITGTLSNQTDLQNALNSKISNPVTENIIIGPDNDEYSMEIHFKNLAFPEKEVVLFSESGRLIVDEGISTQYINAQKVYTPELTLSQIRTFTPATSGTIKKGLADEYVKLIQSGCLCLVNHNVFNVRYYNSSASNGEIYLYIEAFLTGVQGMSPDNIHIVYKVNNDGNLDVEYNL